MVVISGAVAFQRARFGQGTGPILLDDLGCSGTEQTLLDCRLDLRTGDCSHSEDAGVRCRARGMRDASLTHAHTDTLTHSLAYPQTHSITHSLSHSHTHSLTQSHTHSFTHTLIHSLTHSLTHSLSTLSCIGVLIHLLTYIPTRFFHDLPLFVYLSAQFVPKVMSD